MQRSRRLLAGALAALALTIVACSDDDGDEDIETPELDDPDAPAETEAPPETEVPVETEAPADTEAPAEE